jgi:DNA modification methylase
MTNHSTNHIQVLCGDALSLLRNIPSNSADVVIADPPYNLGKDYGNASDKQSFEEYLAFTRAWTLECKRVLKDSGTLYCFMGFRFISYLYQIIEQETQLLFNNWICWHYTQGVGKTKGFSPRHDDILMFVKSKNFDFFLDNVRVPQKYYRSINNMRGANPGDVWEFSHVHYCNENRQNHPTQKPEGLIERIILASSREGATILDPFAGSGTTLRVAQQLGRNAIGIEINPEYVEQIHERLAKPFHGFDTIDPRMKRIPNDLNDANLRDEYLRNHLEWFLHHHQNTVEDVEREFYQKYGQKASRTMNLFEETSEKTLS